MPCHGIRGCAIAPHFLNLARHADAGPVPERLKATHVRHYYCIKKAIGYKTRR